MCQKIIINRGEVEIGTPREFEKHFGFLPEKDRRYRGTELDGCLCQCYIDQTFQKHNIPFKTDSMDYYVGELEVIEFT